ncbi:MAG: hypothetical protein KC425_16890 [Anaerolineales bacterium]|nr:hypothetical protein [Anaerolineales bacterium]
MSGTGSAPRPDGGERPFPIPPRYRPLAGIFLLSVLLSLLIPGFLQRVLVIPLFTILLRLIRLYLFVPQNVMWGILVLYVGYVALRSLNAVVPMWWQRQTAVRAEGPVGRLAQLVDEAAGSPYARWQLAQELETAVVRALSSAGGDTPEAVRQQIAAGEFDLPPAVRALLDVCAQIPNYRRFTELRKADPDAQLQALARLDLDGVLTALEAWPQRPPEAA